jgi:adenylate kinase
VLVEKFGFHHLSTGDLLRAAIGTGTPIGRQADEIIKAGRLMPDDVINALMSDYITEALERGQKLLLDGYPRTLAQLDYVHALLTGTTGSFVFKVFFLDVPFERLVDRLEGRRVCSSCGAVFNTHYLPPERAGYCDTCGGELVQRPDDARDTVRERLREYERATHPVLNALETAGELIRVPADAAHEMVHKEIVRNLINLLAGTAETQAS